MERVTGIGAYTAQLIDRRWLAPGMIEMRLRRPADLTFIPGQYLRFLMDGYQRDYTMVSAPDADTIDFCIAVVDQGRFSHAILAAKIGTAFALAGPLGYFVFQPSSNPAVLVATGTGIAPFVAFRRSGVQHALLLHGVSSPERLVYGSLLQAGCRGYVACISRPFEAAPGLRPTFAGRVTGYLENELPAGTYDFYLCGRWPMIRDAAAIIDAKFSDSRMFVELYN